MNTILYQGRPIESTTWMVLPEGFVPEYKRMSYDVRELVLRDESDALVAQLVKAGKEVIRTELFLQDHPRKVAAQKALRAALTAALAAAGAA